MSSIKLIYMMIDEIKTKSLFDSDYFSSKEKELLNKYKSESSKNEAIASLFLKKKYVGEYYINEYGKPLSDHIFFNISHSHSFIAIAISDSNIGIDIEKIRPFSNYLKEYISSNMEKEYITDEISFFEIWTNKEAIVKAYGVGVKENVKNIPSLPLNAIKQYKEKTFFNKTFILDGYVITVSKEENRDFDIEIIKLDEFDI